MTEITQTADPRPVDHTELVYQIAEYLHTVGVVADPDQPTTMAGDRPAVFAHQMEHEPDTAVVIYGITQNNTVSDSNPTVRFSVAARATAHDYHTPGEIMAQVWKYLHDRTNINLTAHQSLLSCRRVVQDPPIPDANRRWYRSDTYEAVLAVPTQ